MSENINVSLYKGWSIEIKEKQEDESPEYDFVMYRVNNIVYEDEHMAKIMASGYSKVETLMLKIVGVK